MKDIILKRNTLKNKSVQLRTLKFDPSLKDSQIDRVSEEQNKIYSQWKFYDKFIKAREEVKHEAKLDNVGES